MDPQYLNIDIFLFPWILPLKMHPANFDCSFIHYNIIINYIHHINNQARDQISLPRHQWPAASWSTSPWPRPGPRRFCWCPPPGSAPAGPPWRGRAGWSARSPRSCHPCGPPGPGYSDMQQCNGHFVDSANIQWSHLHPFVKSSGSVTNKLFTAPKHLFMSTSWPYFRVKLSSVCLMLA